ncbi:hypothetical protein DICVIV_10553 [Dictyocaulus viviparus]|uniref:Uncharacterized protein n=1 Tax=Dictyocaulus viviparus TaxID=29172 RepID=A0A0D8XI35_DICVI|nr:hypothetical protein DICVIV_10553 [Dictyocaulus viviparus]
MWKEYKFSTLIAEILSPRLLDPRFLSPQALVLNVLSPVHCKYPEIPIVNLNLFINLPFQSVSPLWCSCGGNYVVEADDANLAKYVFLSECYTSLRIDETRRIYDKKLDRKLEFAAGRRNKSDIFRPS